MIDFLASSIPLALGLAVALASWHIGKQVLSEQFGEDMMPAKPYSTETPAEALNKAKKRRIRAEHEQWDAELQAITPEKRTVCAGPKRRHRHY